MNAVKSHVGQLAGVATSAASSVAAWQDQLDWALRIGASLTAILAALLTIRSLLKGNKPQ